MVLRPFIFAVAAAMLVSAPAAVAQHLPAGGVIVQGTHGLVPWGHSHSHLCQPDKAFNGYRCVMGKGEWALLYFSFPGRRGERCAFRVSQAGDPPHSDHFKVERYNDRGAPGRCASTIKSQRMFEVFPTH